MEKSAERLLIYQNILKKFLPLPRSVSQRREQDADFTISSPVFGRWWLCPQPGNQHAESPSKRQPG